MILVGDDIFAATEGEHHASSEVEGWHILSSLLTLPQLRNEAEAFKSISPMTIPSSEEPDYENFVYVFQKEFATANATHVKVHLIGAYDDAKVLDTTVNKVAEMNHTDNMEYMPKNTGYSWPLSMKVIEFLYKSPLQFLLKTLCILEHNTCMGQNQHFCPNVRGFVIDTGNGHIMPARFLKAARAPDGLVRQVRVSVASFQHDWRGGLIDTYITNMDRFVISPFKWSYWWASHAAEVLGLSDSDLLAQCSTSPYAETDDFVDALRGSCQYVCQNPDWRQTFPGGLWRVFTRAKSGRWTLKLVQGKSILNGSSETGL